MKYNLSIACDDPRELAIVLNNIIGGGGLASVLAFTPGIGSPPIDDGEDGGGSAIVAPPNSLDKSGLPWNETIHASSKTQTDAGLWRKKRGVDANLVASVETQLRQSGYTDPRTAAAPAAPPALPPPSIPIAQPPAMPPIIPGMAPPSIPTLPSVPTVPQQPVIDFKFVVDALTRAIGANKMTPAYMTQLAAEIGVTDLNTIQNDGAKMVQVYQILLRDGLYIAP